MGRGEAGGRERNHPNRLLGRFPTDLGWGRAEPWGDDGE